MRCAARSYPRVAGRLQQAEQVVGREARPGLGDAQLLQLRLEQLLDQALEVWEQKTDTSAQQEAERRPEPESATTPSVF